MKSHRVGLVNSMGTLRAAAAALLVTLTLVANLHPAVAYVPQLGDTFSYSETATVNNGQGSYTGYTDQTTASGTERMSSVSGSNVSAFYTYSSQFNDNQGSTTSDSSSGSYTWSASTFTYVNGTDNQLGYSAPVYVWFAINASNPVGGTFSVLNTRFSVLSRNCSFQLPTEGDDYVQTIQAMGTGQYQRNDDYGVFTATYTWYAYFDPTAGYIVGYHYVEQDNGEYQGQSGSFTYTDDLYVTSTSYSLTPASAPPTSTMSTATDLGQYLGYVAVLVVLVLLIVVTGVYIATRKRHRDKLPEHSYPPNVTPPPPPSQPRESNIDLGSKPSEQVVIRDVAKVACKYCGTLIPTTVDRCPYCGGPRQ